MAVYIDTFHMWNQNGFCFFIRVTSFTLLFQIVGWFKADAFVVLVTPDANRFKFLECKCITITLHEFCSTALTEKV